MSSTQHPHNPTNLARRSVPRHGTSPKIADHTIAEQRTIVFVVDNDAERRDEIRHTLEAHDYQVECFADCETFLATHRTGCRGCLMVNVAAPEQGGLALIARLKSGACGLALIAMARRFDTAGAVAAMTAGAGNCLEWSIGEPAPLEMLESAMMAADKFVEPVDYRSLAIRRISTLTGRQREILDLIAAGQPSKNIAADLRISQRTVENHRAAIARKTCSKSLSEVVHMAICANCDLMTAARA